MALIDNLVSYYKLDDNANDSHGSNNGTFTSAAYSTGKLGKAGSFGGSNYISIPADSSLRQNNVSISAWIYPTNVTGQKFIFDHTSISPYYGYNLYILNGKLVMETYGGSTHDVIGSITISTNTRYHVVGTYDGTTMRLYVNNVADTTSTASSGNINYGSIVNPAIGSRFNNNTSFFVGTIDEVGIWSRAMSDGGVAVGATAGGEVAELYNSGNGLAYPFYTAINNLRLGSATPSKIYLGSTEVSKIYLGSDLVYG